MHHTNPVIQFSTVVISVPHFKLGTDELDWLLVWDTVFHKRKSFSLFGNIRDKYPDIPEELNNENPASRRG